MGGSKIKRGDTVMVIRGAHKNQKGRTLRVIPQEDRIVVENVNYVYKHLRRSQQHPRGGRVQREAPLALSNVMFVCPSCNKPTRIGYQYVEESGKRVKRRQCKKCGDLHE